MAGGPKARVMLDTTVLVAGSAWPRWPREVLLAGLRGEVQLVLCPYMLDQAHRVLRKRFPGHLERFEAFLSLAPFELVSDPSPEELALHNGLVRDETDLPIALAAISAQVDHLVSEDKDLTAEDATTEEVRRHIRVLLPGTFLREVMGVERGAFGATPRENLGGPWGVQHS
jgi:predicted nucleic acid-binding protein